MASSASEAGSGTFVVPEELPPEELPPEEVPPEEVPPEDVPPEDVPPEELPPEELPLVLGLYGELERSADQSTCS